MKRNIWIWNHYATNMYKDHGGRHYWFAENLIEQGYDATVFCASTFHNSSEIIETGFEKYKEETTNGIPFVFVKTPPYQHNGFQRIRNMITFYRNLFPVSKKYAHKHGKPDLILASSVHPLTLIAGIKIAEKFKVPCICEVRDLWPESLVAYGSIRRNSLLARLLYMGEKWIYKKADAVIMTWEGGKDYIIEQGWDKQLDLSKIVHISNGLDIEAFDKNSLENQIDDADLNNKDKKNIIYAGSIRHVNDIGMLLDAAKIIKKQGIRDILFLIYGAGDESDILAKRCEDECISNVIFKGRVEKRFVPSILKQADINILHNASTSLDKYGQSQNKFFEYLAAGRCIVQTYSTGYSVCDRKQCGICASKQNAEEIAAAVIRACSDDAQCRIMGRNAREASMEFDFRKLTAKLIEVIEKV